MAAHYHAVLWIDPSESPNFHFNAAEAETHTVHADHPARHLHHKAGTIGSGHAPEDQEFFGRVAVSIADAGIILVTGPANAKIELVKYIDRCRPELPS